MFSSRYFLKISGIGRRVKLPAGSLNRWFWLGTAAILIFSLWYVLSLFMHEDSRYFIMGVDIANSVGWFLGVLFCLGIFPGLSGDFVFRAAPYSSAQTVRRWFPFWIALVFFINCVGFGSQVFYAAILYPFPWWIHSITLLQFPCFLLAILSLSGGSLARVTRVRVVLDGLLILTALVTFSWYFLLGPAVLQHNGMVTEKLLGGSYPCIELFLLYCLIQLVFRKSTVKYHSAHWLLLCGLIGMIISDGADVPRYALQATIPDYWFDLSGHVGYLLMALSVQSVRIATRGLIASSVQTRQETAPTFSATSRFPWRILVPYLVVPAVLVLMIYIWRTNGNDVLALGVYIGGIVLITQILLRQIFITQEAYFYNRELQRMQRTMCEKNLELRMANQHLEERTSELAQAYEHQRQVNDLKDQFLLNVNHELRTPLTEIYGYLDLLRTYRGSLDKDMEATFLDHALHGSEELLQLINSTLDALHSGSKSATLPRSEDLAVLVIVREVQSLFELTIQQNYQLELLIPDTLKVRADRQYLHQVLRNLLSNAFKYSPVHTRVEVGAQCEPIWDGEVLIWVQDAGPGIPPGDIPLLFGKFVRLQRDMASAIRGTGLGLYISKQLVESMGGRIWVESAGIVGKGSRFCFTLPASITTTQRRTSSVDGASSAAINQ